MALKILDQTLFNVEEIKLSLVSNTFLDFIDMNLPQWMKTNAIAKAYYLASWGIEGLLVPLVACIGAHT